MRSATVQWQRRTGSYTGKCNASSGWQIRRAARSIARSGTCSQSALSCVLVLLAWIEVAAQGWICVLSFSAHYSNDLLFDMLNINDVLTAHASCGRFTRTRLHI